MVPTSFGIYQAHVDASIAQNNSALAVVARNEHGTVLKARSKILPKRSPIAAETEAILWVLHLARGENWRVIIVESDSKISIDAILDYTGCPQWAISSLVSDIFFWKNILIHVFFFGKKKWKCCYS